MIIKPYSDIASETFSASNFPALKHFWACKQGAVTSTITDLVAGSNLVSGALAASGNGIVIPTGANASSAALTAPATSACLLIACATWGATGGLSYGLAAGTGSISVGTQAAGSAIFDGTTTKNTTGTQTASLPFTRVTTINTSAGALATATMFETNATTLDVYTNTVDLTAATAITTISAIEPNVSVLGSQITLFGLAFFKFANGLPPQEVIQAAAAWCDYQWRNNSNITMYPGFKGLA